MKRLSVLCTVLIGAGLLFTLATAGAKSKVDKSIQINVSLVPVDSSRDQVFLLFWEEITKSDSRIYYKQISGTKTFGKKALTKGKNEYHDPAVNYDHVNGLYITYNEINKSGSNIIIVGRRVDPDIFDKEINIKFPKTSVYLPPGMSTDFEDAIRVNDWGMETYSPDVVGDENGAHVVWVSQTPGDMSTSEIMYRYIGTDTSSACIQLSCTDTIIDTGPVVELDTNGVVHVFWASETPGNGYDIYYAYKEPSGSFSAEIPIVHTIYDDKAPAVAANDSGMVFVAYETGADYDRDINGFYLESGSTIPREIHLPRNGLNDRNPTVDLDTGGNPYVAWEHDEGATICVMAKDFCSSDVICRVTSEGPWEDRQPSIAAPITDRFPTVIWCRYYDTIGSNICIKGSDFPDDEEIE